MDLETLGICGDCVQKRAPNIVPSSIVYDDETEKEEVDPGVREDWRTNEGLPLNPESRASLKPGG